MFTDLSKTNVSSCQKESGFTQWDALCLAGVVSVLFLLATTASGNSRWSSESQAARCKMNLKLLQQAFQLYAEDNDGVLVENEDNENGGWVRGIIDFSGGPFNRSAKAMMDPSVNLLAPYTQDAYIYRCPSDKSIIRSRNEAYLRVRSVSLSGAMGTDRLGNPVTGGWLPSADGWKVFTSLSDLEAGPPSQLITFMVEHPDSINDASFGFRMPGIPSNFPDFESESTHWVDFPASFHNGGDSIAFADGSVQTRYWTDERSVVGPSYGRGIATNPTQPNNADILWLAARISRPSINQ